MKNVRPAYIGNVFKAMYDGKTDDLLTGGLGWDGLIGGPPQPLNPVAPTIAELRRLAIRLELPVAG